MHILENKSDSLMKKKFFNWYGQSEKNYYLMNI